MNNFLAIAGTIDSYIRIKEMKPTWYCVPFHAMPNDNIFFYSTQKIANKDSGVFAKYSIQNLDKTNDTYCVKYGNRDFGNKLVYAEINPYKLFEKPLAVKYMKSSGALQLSSFISRNFQGTCFEVSVLEAAEIERLIANINKIKE